LPSGFIGVVELSSVSPFVAITLRSLLNSRGDFLLTTFPVADARRTAPSPIVFPQIATGGGFTTQFIFINASGVSTPIDLSLNAADRDPMSLLPVQ
jgi:hypothetical protein